MKIWQIVNKLLKLQNFSKSGHTACQDLWRRIDQQKHRCHPDILAPILVAKWHDKDMATISDEFAIYLHIGSEWTHG